MSKTLKESELKAIAETVFLQHPKQAELHLTKDGNAFLSEHKNAAELHAKSIGKVTEVFTYKNENLQIEDSENQEDSDEDFNLEGNESKQAGASDGKEADTEVVPTDKSKVDDIKAYLTLKGINIPEEAKTKALLLALIPTKNEGE